jgi:ABC-type multidrug transport system fused ATPase/permease subunit
MTTRLMGRFKHTLLGELSGLVGPYVLVRWRLLVGSTLAVAAATAADILRPWPLKFVFDYLLKDINFLPASVPLPAGDPRTWLLVGICALIFIIWILSSVAAYFGSFLSDRLAEEVVYELRIALFRHVQRLSLTYHDEKRIGDMLVRITRDTDSLRELFGKTWIQWTLAVLTLAGTLGVMFMVDWHLAGLGLLTLATLTPIQWSLRWQIKGAAKEKRDREVEVSSVTQETIGSLRVVKAFGREDAQQAIFDRESAGSLEAGIKAARLEARYVRTVDVITAIATCGVIWFGVRKVFANQLTPGDLYLFAHYVRSLNGPLREIAKQSVRISRARVGMERVLDLVQTEDGTPDSPNARPAPRLHGTIEFDKVSFGYKADQPVLRDVSFKVEPGEIVALVGYTGAGKSSIVNLIPRLYEPTAGRVLIDGDDIRNYQLSSLRDQISVVLQESVLFQASLLKNIRYGRPDATREEVINAARAARVDQFAKRLPDGYHTVIGPRGATLSGGERQRVAVARAMIRNAPILILDEPTTGLDAENEQLVMEALEHLMRGKTTLLISHRLSLIERVDRIVVVDAGQIVESGTPPELRATGGLYARLCEWSSNGMVVDKPRQVAATGAAEGDVWKSVAR